MYLSKDRCVVFVLVIGGLLTLVVMILAIQPGRAAGPWYVAPSGDDGNNCLSSAAPCATINAALAKPGFVASDTIMVSIGTYLGATGTNTVAEVVLLDKDATLSGGWDTTFTNQRGTSTIDGEAARRGMTVSSGVAAIVERFTVQGGWADEYPGGGGICNSGVLTLNDSAVSDSAAIDVGAGASTGGGINNSGVLTLNNSTVSGNEARTGNGIKGGDAVILNNSTVSNNTAQSSGGGIAGGNTVTLNNSTLSGNSAGYRGGGINNSNTLTLNNSTVSGNSAENQGGGITSGNALTLNNSTVSGNTTSGNGGGIYSTSAIVNLSNSTISGNRSEGEGGGIRNWDGTVTLQNTILAGNMTSATGPDCGGEIGSLGYNLVGDTSDCTFASTTGDLTDVDAKLLLLSGVPAYYRLRPDSPAIDADNPSGCTDHLGNPLATDQPGTPRPLDGDGDAICDIGSYEFDPDHPISVVSLPGCTRHYCPDFFDDFGSPASGWEVVDDAFVRSEYLNGEYRILTKRAGYFYLFWAPTCDRENYVVDVDVRWVGTPGSGYGLVFGITSGFEQYYLLDINNTDYRHFRLLRRDPSGFTVVVPVTGIAPYINPGTASNHRRVSRIGDQITLEVNGTALGTWSDDTIGSLTGAGLVTKPYDHNPTSDARFDNFSITSLSGTGASAQGPSGVQAVESELLAPNARRVPAPPDMDC